jgi:hypothetical protein
MAKIGLVSKHKKRAMKKVQKEKNDIKNPQPEKQVFHPTKNSAKCTRSSHTMQCNPGAKAKACNACIRAAQLNAFGVTIAKPITNYQPPMMHRRWVE